MRSSIQESGFPVYLAVLLALGICVGAECDNDPPAGAGFSVDAGPDQTVSVGDTVMLMGTSTGVATHKWELTSRPAGSSAAIQNERSLTGATFVADQEGQYVATLIGAVSNNPTAPDVNPADTDTVTITAVRDVPDGGTGGAGGAPDPCAIALPEPAAGSNLVIDVYAALDQTPGGISFGADGTLFIGTNVPEPTSPVLWVSPDATSISASPDLVEDPDAVIVDRDGLVAATAGNVLIGGSPDGGTTGQIVEMTPDGRRVGDPFLDACLRNINHLVFDRDERLLATNFNNQSANVCAVMGGNPRTVVDLIPDVEGEGPAGLTVQDPSTGNLFVTSEGAVHRYSADGTLQQANDITGSAMAFGPAGSPFEGLLVRRSGMLLVRDLGTGDETPILTGSVGSFVSFDADANLYLSDPIGLRVLRVSLESRNLPPTAVGCPP